MTTKPPARTQPALRAACARWPAAARGGKRSGRASDALPSAALHRGRIALPGRCSLHRSSSARLEALLPSPALAAGVAAAAGRGGAAEREERRSAAAAGEGGREGGSAGAG